MNKGFVHVYTGNGKGKTTCAVGLAVRARSRGLRVLFSQFMKKASGGETSLLDKLGVDVMVFERILSPLFNPSVDREVIRKEALVAIDSLGNVTADYQLVVLDEFNHLLTESLIKEPEALGLINRIAIRAELVLTGRGAPDWLIDRAEYVTEMKEIKHPLSTGTLGRKGIEF